MTAIDDQLADELLAHQLDLFRLEAGTRVRVLAQLERLQRELESRLQSQNLTAFSKARLQKLLREATEQVDQFYTRIQADVDLTLRGLSPVEASGTAREISSALVTINTQLPTQTFLARIVSNTLIHGAASAEWWSRQSQDTAFRFANAVRAGLAAGETNEEIVNRVVGRPGVPGVMEVSKRNARSLIHASVQAVANNARLETFKKNAHIIKGVRQLSTLDNRTTDICIAYSGGTWDLEGNPTGRTRLPFNGGPPRHWGCRSVLVPITKTFRELGIRKGSEPPVADRASVDGPIEGDVTFNQFLKRKGKLYQDEVLGAGRADLWRRGVITLQQLLDLQGNPLSLRELKARYA